MEERKNISYKIQMLSDWHCGTGLGSGAFMDTILLRDDSGRPYIPGKTLKGLARENAELLVELNKADRKMLDEVFGVSAADRAAYGNDGVFFKDAYVVGEYGTRRIQQIRIDTESGTSSDGSLRSIEVATPCLLEGALYGVKEEWVDFVQDSLMMVKRLGLNRNRGLGRCRISGFEDIKGSLDQGASGMKFRCRLLTDVILNSNSATEQKNSTLDYIPGNVFLGIAAKTVYSKYPGDAMTLLHSGQVRWGDAHLASVENGEYRRTLHVPASLYWEKTDGTKYHQHHLINGEKLPQLVQARSGFYDFTEKKTEYAKSEVHKKYVLKSTYGVWNQKPEDKQLFGLECLEKGIEFLFEVGVDETASEYKDIIRKSLVGTHRIGASHSSQFGLVEITGCDYVETAGRPETDTGDDYVYVYADSRLIFLDDNGEMTCAPTHICNHKVVWEKSQIRTFEYYPWNGKRSTRDAGRYGMEKGSVIALEKDGDVVPQYIGSFVNEGFGKVIVNPHFLFDDKFRLSSDKGEKPDLDRKGTKYQLAARFASDKSFIKISKSQWGRIRELAGLYKDDSKVLEDAILDFISKGVRKWPDEAAYKLKEFIAGIKSGNLVLPESLILLSSYAAKTEKESEDKEGKR